jgi:PTH1 family peptidyl-tRNA hydrolase
MKLIVGLGNIGDQYAQTRHNIGFRLVDELAQKLDAPAFSNNDKFKAQITEAQMAGDKMILAKPSTMMNLSGEAVQALVHFYKIDPADIWVLYDEIDLGFGKLRIRQGGGDAGHNGVKSIISAIGDGFVRFRFGTGSERHPDHDTADFVLSKFTPGEQEKLPSMLENSIKILTLNLESKVEDTTYNLI